MNIVRIYQGDFSSFLMKKCKTVSFDFTVFASPQFNHGTRALWHLLAVVGPPGEI